MTLRFHRSEWHVSAYHTKGEADSYEIIRRPECKDWELRIRKLRDTAGIRHSLGQPIVDGYSSRTKADLVLIANAYETLGADYRPCDHGHRERLTEAIAHAFYDDEAYARVYG